MKRHVVVFAALAMMAMPAIVRAETEPAFQEGGSVDPAALTHLLEQKGLITPQEEKALTHPKGTLSIDEKTMREYFNSPAYSSPGWQGGPSGVSG